MHFVKSSALDSALDMIEQSNFRSSTGGTLWAGRTRMDLAAETSLLQSKNAKATVRDLMQPDALVHRAKERADFKLTFWQLPPGQRGLYCFVMLEKVEL